MYYILSSYWDKIGFWVINIDELYSFFIWLNEMDINLYITQKKIMNVFPIFPIKKKEV